MTRFIKKLLLFWFILAAFFGFNFTVNYFIYSRQPVRLPAARVLIAGDSHPQKSLNPVLFGSALNIAQPAEEYVMTYWKLLKVLPVCRPDTLVLGFAPHNISSFNDRKFTDELWAGEMFRRAYAIERFGALSHLVPVDYAGYYRILWKNTALYPKWDHLHFIGEYSNDSTSDLSDWRVSLQRHYSLGGTCLGHSVVERAYLDSIVRLCTSKRITLLLVSSPVHASYLAGIPSAIWREYRYIKSRYPGVAIFDRTSLQYPDSMYLNCDHLNAYGADRFTRELLDSLRCK